MPTPLAPLIYHRLIRHGLRHIAHQSQLMLSSEYVTSHVPPDRHVCCSTNASLDRNVDVTFRKNSHIRTLRPVNVRAFKQIIRWSSMNPGPDNSALWLRGVALRVERRTNNIVLRWHPIPIISIGLHVMACVHHGSNMQICRAEL